MINWREKFIAFLVHFVTTLVLAGCAAALVFLVWYPDPFQAMAGGFKFFLLITGVDLGLGPLISFVIYNSRKSRRELLFDYTLVGIVQLAAMAYGVYAIESARPVYVAFVGDRFEVVAAREIAEQDLAAGKPPFNTLPKWGPQLVGARAPTDPKERNELVFSGLSGRDIQVQPKYYVPYDTMVEDVKRRAKPLETLEKRHPDTQPMIAEALAEVGVTAANMRWLPVRTRGGFWTALIDVQTGRPAHYIPIDPY
jgi:hypothetical protein